ncbi:MAG: hypothetical protein JWR21_914 [Herminiimonas sp.]|nr:hypothetical protein [Herminiimonas sp.]
MAFQIKFKPQIVRSAREAFAEGKTIAECPGPMIPWLPIWREAFKQAEIEAQSTEVA